MILDLVASSGPPLVFSLIPYRSPRSSARTSSGREWNERLDDGRAHYTLSLRSLGLFLSEASASRSSHSSAVPSKWEEAWREVSHPPRQSPPVANLLKLKKYKKICDVRISGLFSVHSLVGRMFVYVSLHVPEEPGGAANGVFLPAAGLTQRVMWTTLPSSSHLHFQPGHSFFALLTFDGTNRRWVEVEWRVNGERSDRRPKRGWNGVTRNRRNSHVVLLPLSTRTATPVEDGRVRWGERHEGARVPCVPPRYCRSLCSLPFSIPPRSSRRRKERA